MKNEAIVDRVKEVEITQILIHEQVNTKLEENSEIPVFQVASVLGNNEFSTTNRVVAKESRVVMFEPCPPNKSDRFIG